MALHHIGVAIALEALATTHGCTVRTSEGCRGCRKYYILPWLAGQKVVSKQSFVVWVEMENLEPWIDWLQENLGC